MNSVTERDYRQLESLKRPVRRWMEDHGISKDVGLVDLKCASAFPGEGLTPDQTWVIGVWFLGPRHKQWAALFKLAWHGKVFTAADLTP